MELGLVGQAAGMFAVTNIDDILILALFFGQAAGSRGGAMRVVVGQYLGFTAILALQSWVRWVRVCYPSRRSRIWGWCRWCWVCGRGRAGWPAWRQRHVGDHDIEQVADGKVKGPGVCPVAAVTFANGGDNIGVYVSVFVTTGTGNLIVYAVVFLVLVGVWCLAGRFFATRPVIARALARWGHILLPVVLISIGVIILIEGSAFGL